jgi:hypothetical protein
MTHACCGCLLAPRAPTAMARLAAAACLIYLVLLSLSSSAHAQASPPTPREVFSAPHTFHFFGYGVEDCDALFSLSEPSVTYTPPASGVPSSLFIPASVFAVNGTACDAGAGAEFAVLDIGVNGNPSLNLFVPAENLLYVYGPAMATATAVGLSQCPKGGALGTSLRIQNFFFLRANRDFQTDTPDAREGKLSFEVGVLYAFFDFLAGDGENRGGSVNCLMRDLTSTVPKSSNAGGRATGGSATGDGHSSPASDRQGLSAGAIAGIVVAVVVLVAGFAALLAWKHVSRQYQYPPRDTTSSSISMTSAV